MITNFFIPELNNNAVQELWFQQDGATCHTTRATIDLLKDTFGDRLISRFGPVNWPPRSCDLTPLDYFLWGYESHWSMRISHKRLTIWKTTFAVLLPIYGHKCWKKSPKIGRPDWATSEPAVAVICQKRHLDVFTRGRIIGKLEEGRSVTSVAAEFGIAHSIVSRLWRQFQTTGTAIRGFSSGRPRGTTSADDRYIVLQARRNRRQTAGEIARNTTQATGRPISRFTVARRLHGCGLFARRPVRCVPLTPAHRRRRFLWCREHRNWRDNEWGRVLFTDESRFSLSSDSHRILIWRERGSRNHPSNIIERDRYGGRGVLVWGGIMLGSRTDLHIFDAGSVNGTRYCNEILLPYVRLFRGAMGLQFLFMDDNAPCHRTVAAEQLLEIEDIERMDWPARSPDLNPIEHVWDFLGRRLAARTLPPVQIREL
ncbi:transposable element Tc1 transposase [Trichonephila clavipes]|nr:transposable element Tc1 transposase [Trichonephila clavipes]